MSSTELALIDAYQRWLRRLHQRGHALWFCTVQFVDMRLPRSALLGVMEREVERVYRTLLTRIVRKPRHARSLFRRPLFSAPQNGWRAAGISFSAPWSRVAHSPLDRACAHRVSWDRAAEPPKLNSEDTFSGGQGASERHRSFWF